ncbi:apoptosis-inducing taf9-like domain 1 family protein [Plasmopara halstedii]|uniref:Apoptosis-inducing taf9-like domain 1 family protein n=1 Tax=Plasmopara halstedii TaxID=4781 RepID=A0A0P1ATV8_PLAHL|nr:apoptosis-inducing taf9-like domain 1 family protein [Plasmopara halstedii]CEG45328.1 apoptosis-inducing taf9-like domain 1 family protein [Plasmopara halstedii]|eukprot:XP_024581697.1 apoptosis-inducing taf9-like domain 1 family protein [Plasmopara halstedii]
MSSSENMELLMRQSILYTVGRICDEEAENQQHEHRARARPKLSKEAMALVADLVYKQAEVMATELQFFARHANRKMIKTEDVILLARKQPNLTYLLEKYQRENLTSSSTSVVSSRKKRKNGEDID